MKSIRENYEHVSPIGMDYKIDDEVLASKNEVKEDDVEVNYELPVDNLGNVIRLYHCHNGSPIEGKYYYTLGKKDDEEEKAIFLSLTSVADRILVLENLKNIEAVTSTNDGNVYLNLSVKEVKTPIVSIPVLSTRVQTMKSTTVVSMLKDIVEFIANKKPDLIAADITYQNVNELRDVCTNMMEDEELSEEKRQVKIKHHSKVILLRNMNANILNLVDYYLKAEAKDVNILVDIKPLIDDKGILTFNTTFGNKETENIMTDFFKAELDLDDLLSPIFFKKFTYIYKVTTYFAHLLKQYIVGDTSFVSNTVVRLGGLEWNAVTYNNVVTQRTHTTYTLPNFQEVYNRFETDVAGSYQDTINPETLSLYESIFDSEFISATTDGKKIMLGREDGSRLTVPYYKVDRFTSETVLEEVVLKLLVEKK